MYIVTVVIWIADTIYTAEIYRHFQGYVLSFPVIVCISMGECTPAGDTDTGTGTGTYPW
jgi:hypothetical protein